MSVLEKFLAGWSFRTTTPALEPGTTVSVFVSGYDPAEGVGTALIGDTRLLVEGMDPDAIDDQVAVRVTEYDPETATGRGEFEAVVGDSSYDV
ncbi:MULTISPECIES: TRAM domain-containing protein [Halopenitus]|uniref:DUF7513 domain-containing protein n=1 Tax=Halopenitus malekzadehii TaxID=1267564 RepID=A0A1H6K3K5_9EURY|nr:MULTISPECIES: TRAM domain-containing protein [Halopenitus]SEH65984.1 hypothetical protein SAMN05192561_12317 [Halopenitus malekzadehii]